MTNTAPAIQLKGQYIKDLSFENPHAPGSLIALATERPAMEVNVNLRAQRLQENTFEVTLHVSARAKGEKGTLFLVDLAYAGVFAFANVDSSKLEPVLLIECPTILFPFARRVVADVTRDGGFPPLMLEPVDFMALYEQNKGQVQRGGLMAKEETAS